MDLDAYRRPHAGRAVWQCINTLVPYGACCALAWRVDSTVLAVGFAALAAVFLIRIFIIQHDCGHHSFLRRGNDLLGSVLGAITLLPYFRWRHDHAMHHAGSGNLGRRGDGDVWTLTVREYAAASPRVRLQYRLYRHPLVLFGIGPLFLFAVWQRCTYWTHTRRERLSVLGTNLALAVIFAVGYAAFGARFLLVQFVVTWLGSTVAVWLFYVQHQFSDTHWASPADWDHAHAALAGSSWYRLPRALHWVTGNIGYHHVHHLSPRIPNYHLARCTAAHAELRTAPSLTLRSSLRCASLVLWCEDRQRLVGWSASALEQAAQPRVRAASPQKAV